MLSIEHQELIRFLDTTIRKQKYGSLNLTVILKDGKPIINSTKVVKMRRRKYKQSP